MTKSPVSTDPKKRLWLANAFDVLGKQARDSETIATKQFMQAKPKPEAKITVNHLLKRRWVNAQGGGECLREGLALYSPGATGNLADGPSSLA
jgi:hypothetical protein